MVESLIVKNRGVRIVENMVINALGKETWATNPNLPTIIDKNPDEVERELILRQLLFLRQDINEIKQLLFGHDNTEEELQPPNPALFLPPSGNMNVIKKASFNPIDNIEESRFNAVKGDVIGDMTMKDIEHEMIERTLDKFNHNRRKAAKALDISERTLYRKIQEYAIGRKKIKL